MKLAAVSFSESSANFHQTVPHHTSEESTLHTHYREVLLYRIHGYVWFVSTLRQSCDFRLPPRSLLTLEDGTDRLSRNVGWKLTILAA